MADVSRGVSTTLGYVLNLGVATLLVTMLLLSAGTLVEDQRERAVRTELQVVGERVAADLAAADRLARASDGGTVRFAIDTPRRVAGASYEIRVNETGNEAVVLVADRPNVEVSVSFGTQTPVEGVTERGGSLVATYDVGNDTLEVDNA